MKILLTAIGKRVQLIKYLNKACTVVGVDCGELIPSVKFVEKFYKVHRYDEEEYIDELLEICLNENVDLLIPLYEKEFLVLCDNREKFKKIGTTLLLSDKKVINICNDKWETYNFFNKNNIVLHYIILILK
jgi:carbamoyl-phosphate synthase large subunit